MLVTFCQFWREDRGDRQRIGSLVRYLLQKGNALSLVFSGSLEHADAKTSRDVSMREREILAVSIISGTPDVARERFNRYMDLAAGREVVKRKNHNPIALFRFKMVADGVPYRMLARYFWERTLRSFKGRFLSGKYGCNDEH
jgi:hypothetical protein